MIKLRSVSAPLGNVNMIHRELEKQFVHHGFLCGGLCVDENTLPSPPPLLFLAHKTYVSHPRRVCCLSCSDSSEHKPRMNTLFKGR